LFGSVINRFTFRSELFSRALKTTDYRTRGQDAEQSRLNPCGIGRRMLVCLGFQNPPMDGNHEQRIYRRVSPIFASLSCEVNMGEELTVADVTDGGLIGDCAYALIDNSTGGIASVRNPPMLPNASGLKPF